MQSQIMEGKKLVEPTISSDDKDDVEAFLTDYEYSSILDDNINVMLKCYLNLPEIPDPAHNLLSIACICKQQQQDQQLLALQAKYSEQFM